MEDRYQPPDFGPYIGMLLIVGAILLLFVFPTIAALVAPADRRVTFFVLTFFVLPGPLGVACAAIANPRPAAASTPKRGIGERFGGWVDGLGLDFSNPYKRDSGQPKRPDSRPRTGRPPEADERLHRG